MFGFSKDPFFFVSPCTFVNLNVILFGIGYRQMAVQTNIVALKTGWAPGLNVVRQPNVVAENFHGFAKTHQAISEIV